MADSVDTIADASGIQRHELLEIWERVKANQAVLNACRRHDFVEIPSDKVFHVKYRCRTCGGEADRHAVIWYRQGLAHAAQ